MPLKLKIFTCFSPSPTLYKKRWGKLQRLSDRQLQRRLWDESGCLKEENSWTIWKRFRPESLRKETLLSCLRAVFQLPSFCELSSVLGLALMMQLSMIISASPNPYSYKLPQLKFWFTNLDFGRILSFIYYRLPVWGRYVLGFSPGKVIIDIWLNQRWVDEEQVPGPTYGYLSKQLRIGSLRGEHPRSRS